jgi:hypothetical protein
MPFRLGLDEANYLADLHTSTPAKREMSQSDMVFYPISD